MLIGIYIIHLATHNGVKCLKFIYSRNIGIEIVEQFNHSPQQKCKKVRAMATTRSPQLAR